MDDHKFIIQIERYLQIMSSQVFVGIKKHIMRIFVVTNFLFLLGDAYGHFHSLLYVSDRSVKLKSPLWLLWDVISFSLQVINEFMSQSIDFDSAYHLNHLRNECFSF